jgi:hypothetical protein
MNDHRSSDSRVVNMNACDTTLKHEIAPSRENVSYLGEKYDNRLKPIRVTGGLLRG